MVHPGIYALPLGSRVGGAIEAAGGLLPDANMPLLNPALPVGDADAVFVPFKPLGGAPAASAASSARRRLPLQLLSINHASLKDLEKLPDIGPTKARAIIQHRPYASLEGLLVVPGIGVKTLRKLRPHLKP